MTNCRFLIRIKRVFKNQFKKIKKINEIYTYEKKLKRQKKILNNIGYNY